MPHYKLRGFGMQSDHKPLPAERLLEELTMTPAGKAFQVLGNMLSNGYSPENLTSALYLKSPMNSRGAEPEIQRLGNSFSKASYEELTAAFDLVVNRLSPS